MVDVVVNNVPSLDDPQTTVVTGETLAAHKYWFTDPAMYHPYCAVDYNNATSAEFWSVQFALAVKSESLVLTSRCRLLRWTAGWETASLRSPTSTPSTRR